MILGLFSHTSPNA